MNAVALPVTALYARVLALLMLVLAFNVIRGRYRAKVGLFDGGDERLGRTIRIHGNFIEYVPIALILKGLVEINGVPTWALHAWGIVIVASRLVHAHGLAGSSVASKGRTLGTAMM
ncbi:MAG: MAPEG family protein [Rhodospirillales bacterium]|nr:MAPEG family protein [Rhodospirillales bacterium]